MLTIEPVRQPTHPLTVIRAAILWIRAAGIPVRLGDHGVHCVSHHAREPWEREPSARGVSPLAAAILHRQPAATTWYEAAAEALDAPIAWVMGCEAGIDRAEPSAVWEKSIHRRLYAAGVEAGTMLREELIRVRPGTVRQ